MNPLPVFAFPAGPPSARLPLHPPLLAVAFGLVSSGCTDAGPGSDTSVADTGVVCPTDDGTGCAALDTRVDLYDPTFSDPTNVTNPLLPLAALVSVVYTGTVDGKPFRTETTLLPDTSIVDYEGTQIETTVIQYMAFSDGRIEEVAIDLYAQDDVGAVWYLGEDVADYDEDGLIYTHEGTWHAGVDGAPLTMNMPTVPALGDAWLAEDTAPEAWEQITVQSVDVTVDGPTGPLGGCVVTAELKLDNSGEEKVFGPGYGELSTGSLETDNLEALALAIPTDALDGTMPAALDTLATATADLFDAAGADDWISASAARDSFESSWASYRVGTVPWRIGAEIDRILVLLSAGVEAEDAQESRHQAVDLARFVYDLRLQYRPSVEVDQVRFDLWLAQVLVDAAAGAPGPLRGDTATLELVWDRFAHTYDAATASEMESGLADLRNAADAGELSQAVEVATRLRELLAEVGWR